MSTVEFQSKRPATPPSGTEILVRSPSAGDGLVQAVYLDGSNSIAISDGTNTAAVTARSQTPSGCALQVQIGPGDVISNIPVVMDYPHHQIHEGETYQYTYAPCPLSSGANMDHLISVASAEATTRTPHCALEIDATSETWVYLYATPTTTASGTSKAIYNRNRNSANLPSTSIFQEPTVSGTGSLLSAWIIGSGNLSGGQSRESIEWDLKSNAIYLVRMTAKAAGDDVCLRIMWYEDLGV